MEKGFYHPSRGYWQTSGEDPGLIVVGEREISASEEGAEPTFEPIYLVDTYPTGTISVPVKPGVDHEWVDGNWVHTPPSPPTPEELREIMEPISPRQLRHGLLSIEVTEVDVDALIAAMPDEDARKRADIDWRTADKYERTHPLIVSMGEAIRQTPEQIDSLWGYFLTI